ncbi:ankyrin repeat domain-containing protein [Streptomyces sp. NPDC058157]|uniref:ankyrin repeat domain-containing protein n=1 Tax=Streptomyces sp. NPDC058157 TaxID=3346360 RepID=UPI0036EC2AC0
MDAMVDAGQGLDWMGRSTVHYCAVQGDVVGLREALVGGADPDLADKAGMTPLHFAAQSQSALAAELLLVAGVMVDVGDRDGNTAIEAIRQRSRCCWRREPIPSGRTRRA